MSVTKRIIAGIFAGIMTLVLLTGCNSVPASSVPSSSSASSSGSSDNSASSEPAVKEPEPDSGSTSGKDDIKSDNSASSAGSKTNIILDNTVARWETSKSYQYGTQLNGSKLDVRFELQIPDGDTVERAQGECARNGLKAYYKITYDGQIEQILFGNDWVGMFDEEEKTCVKVSVNSDAREELENQAASLVTTLQMVIGTSKPQSFAVGTKTLGATVYDIEEYTRTFSINGQQTKGHVTCYYTGNSLKWVTLELADEQMAFRIDKLTTTPSNSAFEVPSGYTVYIMDETGQLYDEAGNRVDK